MATFANTNHVDFYKVYCSRPSIENIISKSKYLNIDHLKKLCGGVNIKIRSDTQLKEIVI